MADIAGRAGRDTVYAVYAMIYCESCAKILDEDVKICPHCDNEDPNWDSSQWEKAPEPVMASSRGFHGEVYDKLRDINQRIEERPEPPVIEPHKQEDKPGVGLYIALIFLAVCLSFVGVIVGIVFAMKENRDYKALGIMTAVISGIFLLFGFVGVLSFVLFTV